MRAMRIPPKSEWGPPAWHALHCDAIDYTEHPTKSDRAKAMILLWQRILKIPCAECRAHAIEYIREYPPDLSGSREYQTWMWRFHNAVNLRLGKPLMTAEEYQKTYDQELFMRYRRSL